ncbi:hypothetical protein F5Y16DRAFT_362483 [Xylariaceae sp. FL0255]|nr:hypothetical protein F5Y16DRAFT_362483 [Xylariaceae sp. FL0255]
MEPLRLSTSLRASARYTSKSKTWVIMMYRGSGNHLYTTKVSLSTFLVPKLRTALSQMILPNLLYLEAGLYPTPGTQTPSRGRSVRADAYSYWDEIIEPESVRDDSAGSPLGVLGSLVARALASPDAQRAIPAITRHLSGSLDSILAAVAVPKARPLPPSKRVCYYLIAGLVFGISASLVIALWWAYSKDDISGGFTVGSYVTGVVALSLAAAGLFHAPRCRCWKEEEA